MEGHGNQISTYNWNKMYTSVSNQAECPSNKSSQIKVYKEVEKQICKGNLKLLSSSSNEKENEGQMK